ncbi:probable inactive receptor kinase At1g48480 [Actinidia eriantha]|uniref:probable inactive receptor kinase At1g48480 n=1 Tax=Actinidia eriantha TaxID=165200 RepID=UPI002585B65B|nr:probable inactive receptor kinase At1g48480 [Actinidia eriantha]
MFLQFSHRHFLKHFLCIFFFLLPAANSDLAADRAALIRLRSAVLGRTQQWNLSDPSPCSWRGVFCDNATSRVTDLRLPGGGLAGEIPINSVGNLTSLINLSLRGNSLSGPLPSDLSSCTELQRLSLQGNQFSGEIPATLFALTNLVSVNLAGNGFSGDISTGFNNLSKLRILYLENNNLTGSIPDLNKLSGLREFNVSHNNLNGSIPSSLKRFSSESFLGNSLCNSPLDSCPGDGNDGNKLSTGVIAGIAIGSVIGLILILVALFFLWRNCSYQTNSTQVEVSQLPETPPDMEIGSPKPILVREYGGVRNGYSGDVGIVHGGDGLVFWGDGSGGFGLEEVLRASAEVLGKGTFGSTYKAYLEGEGKVVVVVKRLRNVCVGEREFREKVEGFGKLVHENLVPLNAYYDGKEEKLLVYDSFNMGSLSALLHGNRGADRVELTWEIRIKIAFGAALCIEYLHSQAPNISHGNIRSSNILLTDSYGARVSEHGIHQLVSSNSTLKLNGYCAPEVTDTCKISQKADVYSFGILLLELLTGRTPADALSNEEGLDLPRWVKSVVQEKRTMEVFDPELLRHHNKENQMVRLLNLGTHCTSQHPAKRPSMVEVARQIKVICTSRET